MANSDGQVRITIDTNAKEAVKDLNAVDKAFKENAQDGKQLSSVYSALEKEAQEYTEKLRAMALGGNTTSKEFQRLAKHVRDVKAIMNDANKAVDKAVGGFQAQTNGMAALNGMATKLIGGFSALMVAKKAFDFSMQSVQAFREQERAIKSLNNALMNAGAYSYEYSQSIQRLASEIQKYSNYGDEAIIKAQALGQAYVGHTKISKELTKATVDFAAATGMDLDQAFSLVGKSVGSQTNALARYGIQLQKGMSDTQKMDAITKQLAQRYEGSAAAMADGTIQLKNAIGDLAESFGRILDPNVNIVTKHLLKLAEALKIAMDRAYAARAEINKLSIDQSADRITALYIKREKLVRLQQTTGNKNPLGIVHAGTNIQDNVKDYQKEIDKIDAEIKAVEDHVQKLVGREKNLTKESQARGYKMTDDYGISSGSSSEKIKQMKDDYEKLQEAVAKAKREIQLAAIAHGTSSQEVQNAFTKYKELNTQLTEVDALFEENKKKVEKNKTEFEKLNEKIQETKDQLAQLYFARQGNSEAFKSLKNQLSILETEARKANTAINSQVGIDWTNTANSIKSQLTSALTTPFQQGETVLERFGNLAFSIIQQIGQQLLQNLVIEPAVDKLTTAFQGLFTSAQPLQKVGQILNTTGQAAAQTATSMTTLATSQAAASTITASTSTALASSAATYASAAVAARQLAGALTQAAISQAAYTTALIPMVGGFLAPVAATLTGAAIAAGNVMASASSFLTKFSNGGVFQNGNVVPFAKGGIVNKPTLFPMANGGTGLMGEAGAEAVMPLRRMSNGRLGVEADTKGNGTVVNIYNQSKSEIETRKRDNGSMDIIIKRVNDALMNERTSTGFRTAYQREDRKGLQAV